MSALIRKRTNLIAGGLALLASLLGTVGCAKNRAAASPSTQDERALRSAGQTLLMAKGCLGCHSIGGQGGRRPFPDLTHTAAKPGHTPQWFVEQIQNPKTHNPASRMPAYEGRLSEGELRTFAAYLASLK